MTGLEANRVVRCVSGLRSRGTGGLAPYVTAGDGGLARPQQRLDFYARAEAFLARHLGGRVEPAGAAP